MLFRKQKKLDQIKRELFLLSDGLGVQISNMEWRVSMSTDSYDAKVCETAVRILKRNKERIDAIRDMF